MSSCVLIIEWKVQNLMLSFLFFDLLLCYCILFIFLFGKVQLQFILGHCCSDISQFCASLCMPPSLSHCFLAFPSLSHLTSLLSFPFYIIRNLRLCFSYTVLVIVVSCKGCAYGRCGDDQCSCLPQFLLQTVSTGFWSVIQE